MANPETASFPGAVMTDNDIPPWSDRIVATLVGDMNNSQTTFTLSTTTVDGNTLNTPCILTIGNERIRVLAMTGAAVTSCTRAFGGSSAATHASGDAVRCNLTSYTVNQALAHIKAIETALGVNLGNVPGRSRVIASGNFIVPAGVTGMRITVIGAGGGGAGATTNTGGGGGGAGQTLELLLVTSPGDTISVAYGTGGTAGAINTSGGDGGNTSISGAGITGNTFTALGGKGGTNAGAGGASGGGTAGGAFGSTRPVYDQGGPGGGGRNAANQASISGNGPNSYLIAPAAASVYRGGGGGGCIWGFPGQVADAISGGAQSTMNAYPGFGYGVGGAGGSYDSGTAGSGTGSAGMPGLVIFQWE